MRAWIASVASGVSALLCVAGPAFGQAAPPAPPKIWTVTASAGFALTNGNTDTSSVNAAYDLAYDPQAKNIVKSDGLILRARTEDDLTANRIGINARDEYRLTPRIYMFGQNQYLRDQFKNIDYLLAPTGGLGYKVIDTAGTKLSVDGSAGGVWEKNPGLDVSSSGALALGQKLTQTLTATTTLTESFSGLWKTKDFEDALFILGVSVATSVSTRIQLKIEALDTFKNKPPDVSIQQNDVAVLMAIVYKI